MHDVVKKVQKHLSLGETKEATALIPTAYKAIDKAAKTGVIKPNTASRKKSRLVAAVKRGGKTK